MEMMETARWRGEIEAVEFLLDGACRVVIHRNVFRTLRGAPATPAACLDILAEHAAAFIAAARQRQSEVGPDVHAFHINSRQIRRAMPAAVDGQSATATRVDAKAAGRR
jgi:hypothetical protein